MGAEPGRCDTARVVIAPSEVAGRYELVERAGSGGMGVVYRAVDRQTGRTVALKLLEREGADDHARFAREIELLRSLDHAAIVSYLDHGALPDGVPYLVTEWLDGHDLDARLAEGALSLVETVALGARVARGLAAAHGRDVIHRDIKPSNLFLVDDDARRVKVLDFGVARGAEDVRQVTVTGAAIGTPGYMAPEQARGEVEVDARADIFSLGCVLYECVSGRRAFPGRNPMAVLVKVLLDEVPLLSESMDVPPALDRAIAACLAKDPAQRPFDVLALAAILDEVAKELPRRPPVVARRIAISPRAPTALTDREQRVVAVVVARGPTDADATDTLGPDEHETRVAELSTLAARHGARIEELANGSVAAVVSRGSSATDLARRAVRLAEGLAALLGDVPIGVATGRAVLGERLPVGEAIDEAVKVLRRAAREVGGVVALDDTTAGLVRGSFEIGGGERGNLVLGERAREHPHTLLGRPTRFVGRKRELATLEAIVEEAREESAARIAIVWGESGVGKTRLLREHLARLDAASATSGDPPTTLFARADPDGAGSPFALAAALVRDASGLRSAEVGDAAREKVRARVALRGRPESTARVTLFLSELVGARAPAGIDEQLDAARDDPRLMGDQIRRAFEDFLDGELEHGPLLVVLDDLQWADVATIELVDRTLRNLAERALTVIALARPSTEGPAAAPFAQRALTQIHLEGLTRRVAETLVRENLSDCGQAVDDALVARLVDRAEGNAFYLEELVRAAAGGAGDELPATVMAMAQARLASLSAEQRRVLRAGSVFGEAFWTAGARLLLGEGRTSSAAEDKFAELAALELIERRGRSRFAGEDEWAFRHETVREASYEMLTAEDRGLGHRLAAQWLEGAGEQDAGRMIEHLERAGAMLEAVPWYRRSAESALEADDLAGALALAERGIGAGASGEVLGGLRLVRAQALSWRAEPAEARHSALSAMEELETGGEGWVRALEVAVVTSVTLGLESFFEQAEELLVEHGSPPTRATTRATARLAVSCFQVGQLERAERLLALAEGAPTELGGAPEVAAALSRAHASFASREGDDAACLMHLRAAAAHQEEAGAQRQACVERTNAAVLEVALGLYEDAEAHLRAAHAEATRLGLALVADAARCNLGHVLARLGRPAEARAELDAALIAMMDRGDRRFLGAVRLYSARARLAAGALDAAERDARLATELLLAAPPVRPMAQALLARILVLNGRPEEALEVAEGAMRALETAHKLESDEGLLRLAHAEALDANDRVDEAREAYLEAARALERRAARIENEEWRRSFLERVEEHAITRARAASL